MSALPKRFFTPQEYLTLEANAEYRSQYVAGEIFAMSGAQPPHVIIESNVIAGLHTRFRGRPCNVFSANMRVQVRSADLYTYPDVSALCGEPKFDTSHSPNSFLNPQVIFEVLSPSTEAFDRGDKFNRYRLIESLTDYVLVASERMRIEHYTRLEAGSWSLKEYNQSAHRLPLASVGCELPLAEIYERVTFLNI